MFKIIDKAEKIYYDSSVKYYYRKRENSITTSKNIRLDAIEADGGEIYAGVGRKSIRASGSL